MAMANSLAYQDMAEIIKEIYFGTGVCTLKKFK
jgi:hypothetical protein